MDEEAWADVITCQAQVCQSYTTVTAQGQSPLAQQGLPELLHYLAQKQPETKETS